VILERGPLSLGSTIEELFGRNYSCSGLETENTTVRIRCADQATPLYPQMLALISPTSGGLLVGIIRSQTKATQFRVSFLNGGQIRCRFNFSSSQNYGIYFVVLRALCSVRFYPHPLGTEDASLCRDKGVLTSRECSANIPVSRSIDYVCDC
jgi:hypothetical protein